MTTPIEVILQADRLAYRINELVTLLGVNRRLIERRIADGTLPTTRKLGVVLIPASAVEKLMKGDSPKRKTKGRVEA